MLKQPFANTGTGQFVETWEPHQMGAGSAAKAQLALECSRAVARHEDTAEMCPTDIANTFGTLHRERERESQDHWQLKLLSCCLILHLRGTKRDPFCGREDSTAGTSTRHAEESPLSAILCALAFGIAVREGPCEHQTPNRAYADDLTVWEGKPGGLSKSWDSLTRTLRKAGLDMEPSKYIAWRPHDPANSEPVIPSVEVDTGLIVLWSPAVDGSEMPLGAPMLDESNLANDLHARESRQSLQAGQRN